MNELFEQSVKPLAVEALKRAKMPDNPETQEKMKSVFLSELQKNRYVKDAKNKIIVIDKMGDPIENQHGWPTEADDVIKETFDKLFVDNGMPRSEDEAYRRLRNPNITPEERIQLTKWINGR